MEKESITFIKQLNALFLENDIQFWLDAGTLLGAFRDNKIIPWDTDIDFGITDNELTKIETIKDKLIHKGFKFAYGDPMKNEIIFLKNDVKIEMLIYHRYNEKCIYNLIITRNYVGSIIKSLIYRLNLSGDEKILSSIYLVNVLYPFINMIINRCKLIKNTLENFLWKLYFKIGIQIIKITIPYNYIFPCLQIKFYDIQFPIPNKTEKYLEIRYDKDWKIPNKNWKYNKDILELAKKRLLKKK